MTDPAVIVPTPDAVPPADTADHTPPDCQTDDDAKSIIQSKTLWAAVITAIVPVVFPPAAAVIAANPTLVPALIALGFAGLRCTTTKKVTITKKHVK